MTWPRTAYHCYGCGAPPGVPCRAYLPRSARPGERVNPHKSRLDQQARQARPPGAPLPGRPPGVPLPYGRAGLNQAD